MLDRIKNKIQEREQEKLEEKLEQDLIAYYNHRRTTRGICKQYGLNGQERNISYILRNMNRKLNIARVMEKEDRIEKTEKILKDYKNEILEKIEITNRLRK